MYDWLYQHVFTRLDAERIHHAAINGLNVVGRVPSALTMVQRLFAPRLSFAPIHQWGLTFAHPLGLAGGFDKDAHCLPALQALGFSFIEVGTVTPQPQPGNPTPRLFRLQEDHALINRMGFPSAGMQVLAHRLAHGTPVTVPIFVSLGKNKTTPLADAARDYIAVLKSLYASGDGFVVNISSPNTPDLRKLQTREYLADLLNQLMTSITTLSQGAPAKPLLVKIAPDLTWAELDDILNVGLQAGISGIIATNTTLDRTGLYSSYQSESGGLSGQPLRQRSTEMIRYIARHTENRLVIVGVGGIMNGDDMWAKLEAGASLLQAYTGFIYKGPSFVNQAVVQLHRRMHHEGIMTYQAIGRSS